VLSLLQIKGRLMTIALWCVFVAGILPYICAGIAKSGFKDFDNRNPRQWLASQTGFRARANAAQQNSFEAFPFFGVAVLVASFKGVNLGWIDGLALVFIFARFGFIACYLLDKAGLRSLFWICGIVCIIALFVMSGLSYVA
jgi:uncharacterized MAPEG superfamily protein